MTDVANAPTLALRAGNLRTAVVLFTVGVAAIGFLGRGALFASLLPIPAESPFATLEASRCTQASSSALRIDSAALMLSQIGGTFSSSSVSGTKRNRPTR